MLNAAPALTTDIKLQLSEWFDDRIYGRARVAGTVTGTLFRLIDNTTSWPTSVGIAMSPDALDVVEGTYTGDLIGGFD